MKEFSRNYVAQFFKGKIKYQEVYEAASRDTWFRTLAIASGNADHGDVNSHAG